MSKRPRRFPAVRKAVQRPSTTYNLPAGLDYTVLEPRQMLANGFAPNVLAVSPDGQWLNLDSGTVTQRSGEQLLNLRSFGLYDLQEQQMVQTLSRAPLEFTANYIARAVTISVPRPDLTFARFAVVEAPVMEPGLAAQFPDIKTWWGTGVDDPAAQIRLDMTMHGFHAQVLSPRGNYYVDPYFKFQTELYASYFSRDVVLDGHGSHEEECNGCGVVANMPTVTVSPRTTTGYMPGSNSAGGTSPLSPQFAPPFGTQLRTFRLANAATGEYTAFWGGTVAGGQAAIVTAVNRVTGVYEKEVAIRMVLVANNSTVVYTNPATDPYTNNNGSTMLGQNQTTLDSVIGNANYDIGHVFSTGGGGVAGFGVVGVTGQKARGVTGQSSPTGDPFYIDYVAHEMGHQYRGNHSFNGSTGSCSGGNRNASTAYEPGSASTIMGYAGICGADNLQTFSDAMFHSISIDEIRAFITTGAASGTGTTTATGNAVPTVTAGGNYVIPTQTPFELTAIGSDADPGNVLTYSWEQRDLGAAATLAAADNGASPIFRTWNPTTNPTRVFPRLSNLINNTVPVGEKLPTVAWASMDFRVVIRDNSSGGGGVNSDDMFVQVVNTGSTFQVTSQNTATSWNGLTSQVITWNVAGTTGNGINAANVDILLSVDGGLTYTTVLASATPNDGTHNITVPNISTSLARIKVKATGNIFFDINNVNIVITQVPSNPTVNLSGPSGLIPEGDTGTSQAMFVLTLTSAPTQVVSVNYATSSAGFSNPATDGSDYTGVSGTATFNVGQTVVNIPVTIFGDRFTEGIEQFRMDLSSPSGLILGTSTVTGSISDDDAFTLGKPVDFGTASSPVEVGATGFSTGAYSAAVGVGWTDSSDMISYQLTLGADMTRDMVINTTGNFRIDIPNGNYTVEAMFGIVDFNLDRANFPTIMNLFTVFVEGNAYPLTLETGSNVTRTFSATVADGKLDFGMDSVFVRQWARISGLLITAAGSRGNGSGGGGNDDDGGGGKGSADGGEFNRGNGNGESGNGAASGMLTMQLDTGDEDESRLSALRFRLSDWNDTTGKSTRLSRNSIADPVPAAFGRSADDAENLPFEWKRAKTAFAASDLAPEVRNSLNRLFPLARSMEGKSDARPGRNTVDTALDAVFSFFDTDFTEST